MSEFKVDFIGIGSPRCGTTWASYILKQHPEVCFSSKKEIKFFNNWNIRPKKENNNYKKGLDWYRQFWPADIKENKKIGEFSPQYLVDKKAPKRIKKHFPDVKLIIFLRDPSVKLFTHHLLAKSTIGIGRLKDEDFIESCLFAKNIKRYLKKFSRKQIKVFLLDDVKEDSEKVAKRLYKFIGVDNKFNPDLTQQNKTKVAQDSILHKIKNIILKTPIKIFNSKIAKTLINQNMRAKLSNSNLAKFFGKIRKKANKPFLKSEKPEIPEKLRKKLYKQHFKEDVEELEEITGRNLRKIWNYKNM